MASIDMDISGHREIQEKLEQTKQNISSNAEFKIESNAEYSPYLEFGTRHMPPYPFFYPAINEYIAGPERFLQKNIGRSIDQAESVTELLAWVASSLETQMKKNVTAQSSGGRSPGTHPEHPKVVTGNLRSRITSRRIR